MRVGHSAQVTRTFAQADAATFAALTGIEPASVTTVPEPLIAALFSYLLGVELPGFGTNYLKQEMQFVGSADFGEELTAQVTVTRLRPDKHLADLETICRRSDGAIVCTGRALVLVKDRVETS